MNIRRRALLAGVSSLALMGLSPAQQLALMPSTLPSLVLDFINGGPTGDSRLTTTRAAGGATYFDSTGTLQLASANTQRIDHNPSTLAVKGLLIEESRVNSIRNPRAEGATASDGVEQVTNGTFAANPINAAQSTVQNGWSWVATGTGTVVYSAGAVQLTGDGTNVTRIDTSITTIAGTTYALFFDVTGNTITVNAGNVQGGTSLVNSTSAIGTGQAVSFTASATTTWISFNKVPASTATVDNVSVKKAGVLPTNWSQGNNGSGLISSIVGSGTESGLNFVDVRVVGIASLVSEFFVSMEGSITIAAVQNQTWAVSSYVRMVGGTTTGVNNVVMRGAPRTAGNAGAGASFNSAGTTPTANPLATSRVVATGTLIDPTVAFIWPLFVVSHTASSIDITLRIGVPQCELGAFATSPILPAIGTPAATTRAADAVSMALPAGIAGSNSWAAEVNIPAIKSGANARIIGDTAGARAPILVTGTGIAGSNDTFAGVNAANTMSFGVIAKIATAYTSPVSGAACVNAGAVVTGAQTTGFAGMTAIKLMADNQTTDTANGWLRKVTYWPRTLSSAELQAATT